MFYVLRFIIDLALAPIAYFYMCVILYVLYRALIMSAVFVFGDNDAFENLIYGYLEMDHDLLQRIGAPIYGATSPLYNHIYLRFIEAICNDLLLEKLWAKVQTFNFNDIVEKKNIDYIRKLSKTLTICWNGIDVMYLKGLTFATQRLSSLI